MTVEEIITRYQRNAEIAAIHASLNNELPTRLYISGLKASQPSFVAAAILKLLNKTHIFVLPEKESAAYFHNDLETIFEEKEKKYSERKILFLPTSYKRPFKLDEPDSSNILLRSETLNKIIDTRNPLAIITYPEALAEKVPDRITTGQNSLKVKKGDEISFDFMTDFLIEMNFERVNFVVEPGQFAVRGGIIDVFSFSDDHPFRIEFFGNEIESMRTFDTANQLTLAFLSEITIMPDLHKTTDKISKIPFIKYIDQNSIFWFENLNYTVEKIESECKKLNETYLFNDNKGRVSEICFGGQELLANLNDFHVIEFGARCLMQPDKTIEFQAQPQLSFNKNFDMLITKLNENSVNNIDNFIFTVDLKQAERLHTILDDIQSKNETSRRTQYYTIARPIHEGFTDFTCRVACFTDHQIFDRYHLFHIRKATYGREALSVKELYNLQPGDFVTHIDHGVGRFDGLETIENNGRQQEAIRLVYQDGDLLYLSIHSLHRIAKFIGKEGIAPSLNKLGTNNWNRLKERTKKKVKDIARDLIKLYSARRASNGFSFSPDSYLQHELEASFIYEDTPDQLKATIDVKADLEKNFPMDRLICGDVGFGKTEVAIRAAFKAVTDSKQVAVLVPTTILALQHFKTFSNRLNDFPVNVEYINRFKSTREQKQIIQELEAGRIDILIGTHRLVSNDVKFKDLGLLIIDEEQKFGVSIKEKLKKLKVNVDTLTLTATPIPRTLQFSLMGARDLSVINTPPANRIPVITELHSFSSEVIKSAINFEVARGGQVFFVHNKVQNINEVAEMVRIFCPRVKVGIGHGQLQGAKLEQVMLDFIEGDYDVLVATTIVENGLDIPNANTIIINNAQNYGLSDLYQLKGRVGRANRQAFCYLLSPPLSTLNQKARKRLKAIEEFSSLGSGFSVAMRDLDIRGAGNILGAEQSGFISEIGFEMYNKILDEAMEELEEETFANDSEKLINKSYVKDCLLETDFELMIPDSYISITTERLSIYKELDNIKTEDGLHKIKNQLIDRFGPIPEQVEGLFSAIKLRWIASRIGFEKIVLRGGDMTGYFTGTEDSAYYNSMAFTHVIDFLKNNPKTCSMRESKQKLSLKFTKVESVEIALKKLQPLIYYPDEEK